MSETQNTSPYKGSGQLTREQFLFYEMRTTAKLMVEGLDDGEVTKRIVEDNLFQYPTEKSLASISKACIARLYALDDRDLMTAITTQPMNTAKQICLYAMMKRYRLVWDFMLTVIGEKYRLQESVATEQDDFVSAWSDSTIKKIRQVLIKILVENGYLDHIKSEHLNPVLLSSVLENGIRNNNDERALSAFNCFM